MLDKLIYDGEPFFNSDCVSIEIIKNLSLTNPDKIQKVYPGTKTDIISGVFNSLPNVQEFILIVGNSVDNVGLCAIVLKDSDISQDDFKSFESMVYHIVPMNVFLRCFVFSADDFTEMHEYGIEHQKLIT